MADTIDINIIRLLDIPHASSDGKRVDHVGDAHNYRQLEVAQLNIQNAIDKLQPEYAFFSHAWETRSFIQKVPKRYLAESKYIYLCASLI